VHRALASAEAHLATRTFLITERITVADIYFAQAVKLAFAIATGTEDRARYPSVTRHFETVYNVPEIKGVFGDVELPEKQPSFTPPKKDKPAAEVKPKEPKAEKPKAEKKPKPEDDDEDIDLVPEEPKAKNPLDSLPKSTFNLEDWKRAYSNMDTRGAGGAIEWFYKKCVYFI
jgi:elongation factor 1-gamma